MRLGLVIEYTKFCVRGKEGVMRPKKVDQAS